MEEEDEQDVDDVDDKIDIANNEEGRGVVLGEKEKEAETKRRSEPGRGERDEAGVGMLYRRKSWKVKGGESDAMAVAPGSLNEGERVTRSVNNTSRSARGTAGSHGDSVRTV